MLGELKWDTCRNYSSAKHMANLISKKIDRKHSAQGFLVVSHSDLEGNKRYSFLGTDNFNIDRESDYDSGSYDGTLTEELYKKSLVPWLSTDLYSIPKGATFVSNSGVVFTAAERKQIKTWDKNWNEISLQKSQLTSFYAQGGWLNYKYLLVPVVQGEQKEVHIGISDGMAGQTFTLATLDIEAADSYYTRQFCYLEEIRKDGTTQEWKEIYHLANAGPTDYRFEIDILDDLSGTIIKFGDGVSGAIPSENSELILHYIETAGKDGNIYDTFCFQNEINGTGIKQEDFNIPNFSVGCQSVWPIIGGKDIETFKEFKKNAESAYSKNYEILHTYTELQEQINKISPIPLIKIITSEFYKQTTINSTKLLKSTIGVSGLSTSMRPLNSIEKNLFENIVNVNLNNQILSNKDIEYLTPNIIKIQSQINLETKEPVVSKKDFENDLQSYLLSLLGKTNIDSIDQYMQSETIKRSLEFSDKIGAIESYEMLSVNSSDVTLVTQDNSTFYFAIKFTTPDLQIDNYSYSWYCNKTLEDGVRNPYIFNVSLGDSANFTFYITEQDLSENTTKIYQSLDGTFFEFYNISSANNKFLFKNLIKQTKTFTKRQIEKNLDLTETDLPFDCSFFVKRYSKSITAYLLLPVEEISSYLGFKSYTKERVQSVKNILTSNIDSGLCNFEFYFTPTDKTIQSDWNTIFYYDNIGVTIDG